jgi:hypothetical protein
MIADALEKIEGWVEAGSQPTKVFADSRFVHWYHDGTIHRFEVDPEPRNHYAKDINSLLYYETSDSVIWCNTGRVVLVIDDSDRYVDQRVTWKLTDSSKFAATGSCGEPRSQKDFIRFIMLELRDELENACPGLLSVFRSMVFTSNSESDGEVEFGKESMGRSIKKTVALGTDKEIPETVTLVLRRWAEVDIYVAVECLVDVNLDECTIALIPLADSIVEADQHAQEQLCELLLGFTKHSIVLVGTH